ncbi:UNVERIFIED_CONTAM: hypothetical protein Cloal_1680 [Acetivibrio alkalicellulosi]
MKTYIFARKIGTSATKIMEIDKKEAVRVMKENRNSDYQLGMLTGGSFDTVIKVYGEYAPFHRVKTIQELVKPDEKIHLGLKKLVKGRMSRVKCKKTTVNPTQRRQVKVEHARRSQ